MMFKLINFVEKIIWGIYKRVKILYWKLKYGKRIEIGKKLSFRKGFNILIENEGHLKIGDNCFFNNDCSINCLDEIIIENGNLFGENIKIYDHNHKFNKNNISRNEFKTNKIHIGNNNWIGSNTVILSKAYIEDNNIIGAGVILNEIISSNKIVTQESRVLKVKEIVGE